MTSTTSSIFKTNKSMSAKSLIEKSNDISYKHDQFEQRTISNNVNFIANFQWKWMAAKSNRIIVLLDNKWDVYYLCYEPLVVITKSARRRMACVIMISFSFLLFKLFPFIECCSTGYYLTINYDWVKYFICNKIKINWNIRF